MSKFPETLEINGDFMNKRINTWEINTRSVYFILGIGCFILSLIIGMAILIVSLRKKREGIKLQDE